MNCEGKFCAAYHPTPLKIHQNAQAQQQKDSSRLATDAHPRHQHDRWAAIDVSREEYRPSIDHLAEKECSHLLVGAVVYLREKERLPCQGPNLNGFLRMPAGAF